MSPERAQQQSAPPGGRPARALRAPLAAARVRARALTASWRMLPNALIIGAQRSGTTALYNYLVGMPGVVGSYRKEVGFFSLHYHRGTAWYRAHFPHGRTGRSPAACLEATPEYLLDPRAPRRIAELLPEVRVIALLRDPVARAASHYLLMRRLGLETLPFERALAEEDRRIAFARAELAADPEGPLPAGLRRYSYVTRGMYAEQLERWFRVLPRERVLVIRSEDLFTCPDRCLHEVCDFLGVPCRDPGRFTRADGEPRHDAGQLLAGTGERLYDVFRPSNERLEAMLGRPMNWQRLP